MFFMLVWRKSIGAVVVSLVLAPATSAIWFPSMVAGGLHGWQVFGFPIILLATTRLCMWAWMADRLYTPRTAALLAGGGILAFALLAGSICYRQIEIPDVGEPFDVKAFAASFPGPEQNKSPQAIKDALLESQMRQVEADAEVGPPKPIRLKQLTRSASAKADGEAARPKEPADNLLERLKQASQQDLAKPDEAAARAVEPADSVVEEPEIPVQDYYDLIQYLFDGEISADNPDLGKWLDEVFQGDWMKHLSEAVRLPLAVFIDPRTANSFIGDMQVYQWSYHTAHAMLARALQLQSRKDDAGVLDHIVTVLALSRQLRNKADTLYYFAGLFMENRAIKTLDRWSRQLGPHPDLVRRAVEELTRHEAAVPPNDSLKADYLITQNLLSDMRIRNNYVTSGLNAGSSEKPLILDILESAWQVPWEKQRLERLNNLLFAGWLRGAEADYATLVHQTFDATKRRESQAWIMLRDWIPPQGGPAASWSREKVCDFIDQSVLWRFMRNGPGNVRVYSDLRQTYLQAMRLQLALMLYQFQEKKPAPSLDALVPKYFPELSTDPFSGQSFHYRLSTGESIFQIGGQEIKVPPGQGILWSVGPDGQDNGGVNQGEGSSSFDPAVWTRGNLDLIFLVPTWPKTEKK
jgi:hypothetical protein